jgi:hypothetical protein
LDVRFDEGKAVLNSVRKVPELSHFFFFNRAIENCLLNYFHSATMAPIQDSKLNALVYQYLSSQEFTEAAKALKKKIGSVSLPTRLSSPTLAYT